MTAPGPNDAGDAAATTATTPAVTRVLVLAPTRKDGQVTRGLLERAGLACLLCDDVRQLAREVDAGGAGAALVTEEAIIADGVDELLATLGRQPTWSELPVVALMRGGAESSSIALRVLRSLTNVTLLERPAPMRTVISAVQAAVRGRLRQYQIRDQIDQIRRGQEAERAARAEAERAGRMKDEFLATLSHELRTPLNAILGWATLLRTAAAPGASADGNDAADGLEVIERNARVQAQLIDDLLDMSRIISGKLRLDLKPVDPASVVDAAVDSVRPAASAKQIRLATAVDAVGPVAADAGRLHQILWNLLSNAVKFTPAGGTVHVTLRRAGDDGDGGGSVELSVADTGEGIRPEFLPHVFERFRQADASTTRRFGGLGLGLAIVKNLVELHGGTIEARSDGDGRGATFVVRLPVAAARSADPADGFPASGSSRTANARPPASPAPAAAPRPARTRRAPCFGTDLSGVTVLVVDDDADARHLVERLLADCNAAVTVAASAGEALQLLPTVRPHVLLSDIGMTVMDGYDFIRRVRADFADGVNLPAAALTAFARPDDRRRALAAGYQTHLPKPIEAAELLAVVASLARRDEHGTPRPTAPSNPAHT